MRQRSPDAGLWPRPVRRRRPGAALLCAGLAALALLGAGSPAARGASDLAPSVDIQALLGMAEQGDVRAAFLVGTRFASGAEGARDDSEAARWFRQAAEAGLAEAQYNLGILYGAGRGVERDRAEAARWFRLAGEQGIVEAQYNLGVMYGKGVGVPRDLEAAAKWLHRAADGELPAAQHNLGVLYEFGRGVGRDIRASMIWYERAAKQGYAASRERLATLRARLGIAPDPGSPAPAGAAPASVAAAPAQAKRAAAPSAGAPAPAAPAAPSSSPAIVEPHRWPDRLDPESYTVQLVSDTDEASVRRFIDRNFEPGEAGYFASDKSGKRWYSAVYGEFATYDAATQAVAALPDSLRRAGPWVRKARMVQKAMVR